MPALVDKGLDIAEVEAEILKRVNKLRPRLDDRFPPTLITRRSDESGAELVLIARIKDPMDKDSVAGKINGRILEAVEDIRRRSRAKGRG